MRSGELGGAVADCLGAAAAELDPLKQAALLKAACYGRAFRQLEAQPPAAHWEQQQDGGGGGAAADGLPGGLPADPRRRMVEVARRLRVLNALREPGVWGGSSGSRAPGQQALLHELC